MKLDAHERKLLASLVECTYPDCPCPVSFPEGYRPSAAMECIRDGVVVHNDRMQEARLKHYTKAYRASRRLWSLGLAVAEGMPPTWRGWQEASWRLRATDLGRRVAEEMRNVD